MVVGEAAGKGRGPLTPTSPGPAESDFVKDAPNNSEIFLEGGRELNIAFSLYKTYSNDDLSFTASRCILQSELTILIDD
jgi:hypothetical protein